ncbi:MAG TPA: MFS transporter [Cellvibrionaceae bacterium]|nr:MFS transporter [Cellvibrionaceae bacterium]
MSSFSQRLRHGLLALPLTFAGLPIYIHAPDYYAVELGIPLATIGFLLLVLRIIDAVQDPLIGALSDRFYPHRQAIVVSGALLLAGGFWLIFHPPQLISHSAQLIWLAVSVFICTTGFSMVSINLQAAGSLWLMPAQERTLVAATREALGLLGLLLAAVVPAVLFNYLPRPAALHNLTLILVPLLCLGVWVFCHWLRGATLLTPAAQGSMSWRDLFAFKWINGFLLVYTLSAFAAAIPGILVLFYVRDYLQLERYSGVFLLLYFLSGVLAMPLWQALTTKISKPAAWLWSMVLACSAFSAAFYLPPQALIAFSLVCIGSGMALGADLALPQAIMADHIAAQPEAASRYSALMAFLSKAALALATGIVLPIVGWFGFQPGASAHNEVLPFAYALVPCCIKALCAVFLFYCSRRYYLAPAAA